MGELTSHPIQHVWKLALRYLTVVLCCWEILSASPVAHWMEIFNKNSVNCHRFKGSFKSVLHLAALNLVTSALPSVFHPSTPTDCICNGSPVLTWNTLLPPLLFYAKHLTWRRVMQNSKDCSLLCGIFFDFNREIKGKQIICWTRGLEVCLAFVHPVPCPWETEE